MNKKTLVAILGAVAAIAIYWLGFVIGVHYAEHEAEIEMETESIVLSDEEIMNFYIIEEYGHEYYGVLDDDPRDGYVEFTVYTEDNLTFMGVSIEKEAFVDTYFTIYK